MNNDKKNLEIIVATHKKADMPKSSIYVPIHVGREGKEDIGYLGDHTGENISKKNPNYCELTAMYWYLKNRLDENIDYIGLNHYRRYFLTDENNFRKSSIVRLTFKDWERFNKSDEEKYLKILNDYDIILPIKRVYPISIKAQYATMHIKDHLLEAVEIIKTDFQDYYEVSKKYLNGNTSWLYNMFIMKKESYMEFMEFVFGVLFKLEKVIEIPDDTQQARVFGFLSERLLNIFVLKNNLKVKELPVAFLHDGGVLEDNYESSKKKANLIFGLSKGLSNYMFFTKNIKVKKSKSKK